MTVRNFTDAEIELATGEEVMGWRHVRANWHPTTRIEDAWLLVDTLNMFGRWSSSPWDGPMQLVHDVGGKWSVIHTRWSSWSGPEYVNWVGGQPTATMAICLAALRIVREWKEVDR